MNILEKQMQEPCEVEAAKLQKAYNKGFEDCRQAVLDYIYNDLGLGDEENGKDLERQKELERSYRYVKSLPPVTPQQKYGKWLYKEITDDYRVTGQCSECRERRIIDNFCPNCGCRMVEPQESEGDACKDCDYNDGEVHAECVVCDKAESEG